jgi:hypothetical protein
MMRRLFLATVLVIGGFAGTARAAVINVDVELSLLVDVSGSVDATEFDIQKTGYVNAFKSAAVKDAIVASPNGVAVNLVYWSTSPVQAVAWQILKTAADADAFAALINAAGRPGTGTVGTLTAIGTAINFGVNSINTNPIGGDTIVGTRKVIDVSGDGQNNDGASLSAARANAISQGITINGLAITTDDPNLLTYYQNNVIGGPGAFAVQANSFAAFGAAVERKIELEIRPIPVPPTAVLAVIGFVGCGAMRRLRWKAA